MDHTRISAIQKAYNKLYQESGGLYHRLAKQFGLSDTVFWILYALWESGGPMTQTEVCSVLVLSKQTVNSALKKMAEEGQIRLENRPEDRRNKRIRLTERGRALMEASAGVVWELEARAFLRLTEEERRELLALEKKYVTALRAEAEKILNAGMPEE